MAKAELKPVNSQDNSSLNRIAQRNFSASQIIQQGNILSLNGRSLKVAWIQWQEGSSIRTGISDTGVRQILGIELANTNNPNLQPIQWFSSGSQSPLMVPAKFINPYRYLDMTDLLQQAGVQIQRVGNSLNLNFPIANFLNIREGNQPWGKRLVVELDRPVFWQVSQAKNEGVITVEGNANPELFAFKYSPTTANNSLPINRDEDDLGGNSSINKQAIESNLWWLEKKGQTTKIHLDLPTNYGVQVSSLANPNRLVIDIRPDGMIERTIVWNPGITWKQQHISLNQNLFPVTWLEIDLDSPKVSLKPITSNPTSLVGIAPLVNIAQSAQAAAAINGGFFNRNTQQPLGAIRQDGRWLSSPILNRGAIAWDNKGRVKIGRLNFQETVTNSTGKQFPILYLNSGFVQAGISRYTQEWGNNYTPMTDNETIIVVENNQVTQQLQASKSGQNTIPIPVNGYLLTIRSNRALASAFPGGTQVNLETITIPSDFLSYPNILAAGPLLLQNRQIALNAESEKFSNAFQKQTASRSAIATTSQGKLIIVAVHNRVRGRGATLQEFAQILQKLGAVDALNLDGGSSTSLSLGGQLIDRSAASAARVHNGIGVFIVP
jgi:exopolysaccharide biosynthesis protein